MGTATWTVVVVVELTARTLFIVTEPTAGFLLVIIEPAAWTVVVVVELTAWTLFIVMETVTRSFLIVIKLTAWTFFVIMEPTTRSLVVVMESTARSFLVVAESTARSLVAVVEPATFTSRLVAKLSLSSLSFFVTVTVGNSEGLVLHELFFVLCRLSGARTLTSVSLFCHVIKCVIKWAAKVVFFCQTRFFLSNFSFCIIWKLLYRFCQMTYNVGTMQLKSKRKVCAIQMANTVFFCPNA